MASQKIQYQKRVWPSFQAVCLFVCCDLHKKSCEKNWYENMAKEMILKKYCKFLLTWEPLQGWVTTLD